MKKGKTAQELMDEINHLKKVLARMDLVPCALEEEIHILSACEGHWQYHRVCEDRNPTSDGDYNESWTCEFFDNEELFLLYDKLLDIHDDKMQKIRNKIQELHDRRNAIAKSIPRSSGLGKLCSIESTFGSIPEEY